MVRLGFKVGGGPERQQRQLVEDCEAFLIGRLAERLEGQGLGVPTWAWTNLLAHGTFADLSDEVTATPKGNAATRDFRRSRAYGAAEVLAVVHGPQSLVELQRQVLQPMELDLSETLRVMWWRPSDLASHVNSVLTPFRHVEHGAPVRPRRQAP